VQFNEASEKKVWRIENGKESFTSLEIIKKKNAGRKTEMKSI
jgi:hypothetical protein